MNGLCLQGSRVNSRTWEPDAPLHKEYRMSEINRRISEAVPYWPEAIELSALAVRFGMTSKQLASRLQAFQDECLIFQDGPALSRLRGDLSNLWEDA
jgi:hypothetical protein